MPVGRPCSGLRSFLAPRAVYGLPSTSRNTRCCRGAFGCTAPQAHSKVGRPTLLREPFGVTCASFYFVEIKSSPCGRLASSSSSMSAHSSMKSRMASRYRSRAGAEHTRPRTRSPWSLGSPAAMRPRPVMLAPVIREQSSISRRSRSLSRARQREQSQRKCNVSTTICSPCHEDRGLRRPLRNCRSARRGGAIAPLHPPGELWDAGGRPHITGAPDMAVREPLAGDPPGNASCQQEGRH